MVFFLRRKTTLLALVASSAWCFMSIERRQQHLVRRSSNEAPQTEFPSLDELEQEYWSSLDEIDRKILTKTRAGQTYLRLGQVSDALACFDDVRQLERKTDRERYLWARGVALFYLERYDEATEDLEKNAMLYEDKFGEPATEERVLAAAAATLASRDKKNDDTLESRISSLLTWDEDLLAKETRIVLRLVTDVFRGTAEPKVLAKMAADEDTFDPMRRNLFSHFYVGLFWDAMKNDPDRAKAHMTLALRRANVERPSNVDLLCVLPKLYLEKRGWDPASIDPDHLQRAENFE